MQFKFKQLCLFRDCVVIVLKWYSWQSHDTKHIMKNFGKEVHVVYIYVLQVVVLASLAQLLVFVELARSVWIEIKDVICM